MGAFSYLVSFMLMSGLLISQFTCLGAASKDVVSMSKHRFSNHKLKMTEIVPLRLDNVPPPPGPMPNNPDDRFLLHTHTSLP
ncbi:hypothetical protein Fmac_007121 [Flemingia macrophylla]|uniref:Transmembrane protein n=1 Tax=Flemingia macrophylla TaxID=520843 RepID=A0ABD1NCK1_9FABA